MTQEPEQQEKNFTVQEAAVEANVKPSKIRAEMAKGALGYLKLGHLVRIPRSELMKWLRSCAVPAKAGK